MYLIERVMIKRLLGIVFLGLIARACMDATTGEEVGKKIDIDISQSVGWFDAKDLLDTIGYEIITLDTTNNTFIGHVEKLSVVGDRMYIWDRDNKAILIYDSAGKFLSKIASEGRAKNEYVEIYDFYATGERLYVLDNISSKLLVYDAMGKFIRTLDVSMYGIYGVFVLGDVIYLTNYSDNTDNMQYHIFKIDTCGNLLGKYVKFSKRYRHSPGLDGYAKMNDVFHVCCPKNKIYRVDSASCELAYNIDFKDKNLPDEYDEIDLIELIKKKELQKRVTGIDRIRESSRFLFISFWYDWEYYTAIYNKTDERVVVCKGLIDTSIYQVGELKFFLCNDCLYSEMDANNFKAVAGITLKKAGEVKNKYLLELERVYKTITEYSNPVIIRYKLK